MVFACASPLSQLPVGIDSTLPAVDQALGRVALLVLIGVYAGTLRTRRAIPFEPVIVALLILAAGLAMVDPMVVIGLGMGTLVHQSLYGGRRAALLRTLAVCAAYLLTIALSAAAARRGLPWNSSIVLGNLPGIVGAGVVMRVLLGALTSHEQTAARDRVLARAAADLLGQTDVDVVRRMGAAAGAELCGCSPASASCASRSRTTAFASRRATACSPARVARCCPPPASTAPPPAARW